MDVSTSQILSDAYPSKIFVLDAHVDVVSDMFLIGYFPRALGAYNRVVSTSNYSEYAHGSSSLTPTWILDMIRNT